MQPVEDARTRADACRAQWRKARGFPMADAARHGLAVKLGGAMLEPADVSLWEEEGAVDPTAVPLEFLFAGAPAGIDEQQLGTALSDVVHERLQEERREEFRSQLQKRQESTLRRRGAAAADEGGDDSEEKWRGYLRKPAPEVKLTVHGVFDAGTRVRRVLGCRVSMSPQVADELGKICFRHIFETEEEEKERLGKLKWYEDPFLMCFYSCFCVLATVVLLWVCMLVPAVMKHLS
eukprot:gb/GFBE01023265.1/.p1 GENE.gb/GFBE01023265.1/~~gb/GFBE01023265.1/.p1  ORF type:complete len:235 (+),score=66.52 gb/GFBE01023265.1/:1-705(+)